MKEKKEEMLDKVTVGLIVGLIAFVAGIFLGLLLRNEQKEVVKKANQRQQEAKQEPNRLSSDKQVSETNQVETEKTKTDPNSQKSPAFTYKNVSFKHDSVLFGVSYTDFWGEVTNNSGGNYTTAVFRLSIYDENQKLQGTSDFYIHNFSDGQTRSFDEVITVEYSLINSYKIDPEGLFN